jgi:HD superfamily phosphohydrolase
MVSSKIINDPVHGFIEVPKGILLDLIDTEEFQRLRRIKQLALSSMVYPGAVHTRFNHCIGAMHLTREAMTHLRQRGVEISDDEFLGTLIAILLHDIGHGPFSHALESVIVQGLNHERMSIAIMRELNRRFNGRLETAIQIFEGRHPKAFLHQLVSGQLDMDRMDYLKRDSYFTGVVEGLVSDDRIIKTLDVADGRLVVASKGIYSVEKFIMARRLMYWQVYLHKAVLSAENMIVNILRRARELRYQQRNIWMNDALDFLFSQNQLVPVDITPDVIKRYIELDDEDIMFAIKQWRRSDDKVLQILCASVLQRRLLKARLQEAPVEAGEVSRLRDEWSRKLGLGKSEIEYFVFTGEVSNLAYLVGAQEPIGILYRDGTVKDITEASDMQNIAALSTPVRRHYLCHPA